MDRLVAEHPGQHHHAERAGQDRRPDERGPPARQQERQSREEQQYDELRDRSGQGREAERRSGECQQAKRRRTSIDADAAQIGGQPAREQERKERLAHQVVLGDDDRPAQRRQ